MSFFRANTPTSPPAYTSLQLQTSSNAVAIPIAFGKTRVSFNLIWYGDFFSVATEQATGGASGKGGIFGGGSGGSGSVTFTYFVSLIMALCEGPVTGVDRVWKNTSVFSLAGLGMTLFTGTTPQAAWSYLNTTHPDQALAYNGTAYAAVSGYGLGSSPVISSHSFEMEALRFATGFNGIDADPALCIQDILTSSRFGLPFPAASLDLAALNTGPASVHAYCWAQGLAFSPAVVSQETGRSVLQRWCDILSLAPVWSGGLLKFVPYADAPITGNGTTFTPATAPVYALDLSDDDYLQGNADNPVTIERSDPMQRYNRWDFEVLDRSNSYNAAPVRVFDQDGIEKFGLRPAATFTAHEICDLSIASVAAQLTQQRQSALPNTYVFELPWEFCLLDPMDVVTIVDSYLIAAGTTVRITDIEEDADGLLTVTAQDFVPGVMAALPYATQSSLGGSIDLDVAAPAVNTPMLYLPAADIGQDELWIGASGAGSHWGGAFIWLSVDGASYFQSGKVVGTATQGTLTADLPAYASGNPDTGHTLSVDLTMSQGTLSSVSDATQAAELTLCLVGAELLTYRDVALTSAHHYDVTNLNRALHATTATLHGSGAPFTALDSAIAKITLTAALSGAALTVKLQSFNEFGQGVQDLATCVAYSVQTVLVDSAGGALVDSSANTLQDDS